MAPQKSSEQCKVFLDFMESHPDMAKGFVRGDKVNQEQLWADLTNQLNACGPPNRNVSSWKKTWCDWRRSIKTRLAENKTLLNKTGGGDYQQHFLSPIEERLAIICNIFHAVEGIPKAKSFGPLKQRSDTEDVLNDLQAQIESEETIPTAKNENLPKSSDSLVKLSHSSSAKKKKWCGDIENIIDEEKKSFENIADKLEEIKETIRDNNNYLKNISSNINEIRLLKKSEYEENNRHNLEMEKLTKSKLETNFEFLKLERMKMGLKD